MNKKMPLNRNPGRILSSFQLLILLCTGGLLLLLVVPTMASSLQSNIAWINLNRRFRNGTSITKTPPQELEFYAQAIETDAENRSAWFGLGLSYALQGEVESAISAWKESETDTGRLIEYGKSARRAEKLDIALIIFRAADAMDYSFSDQGYMLAGTICQRSLVTQNLLSESNLHYCSNYLADNGNNLIVNGDFSPRAAYGWEGQHFFAGNNPARFQIEDLSESGDPVIKLTGQDESSHFGLYQPLILAPGTTVRFSGRFKISGEDNLIARILYISWQTEDGAPQGNHGEQRSKQMGWTRFERTFRVPENVQPTINFYPVNFTGEGTIWFDDIQLELVTD
jgi:hypothetical protein